MTAAVPAPCGCRGKTLERTVMEAAIALWHSATPTGACADSARPSRSPPSVMPSWFSRLAAALLGMLPWRRSSDPGACILLGEGRGVTWCGDGDAAGRSLNGPTPPPAR